MLFAVFLFATSDAVHKCEVEEKNWSAEHRPHSRPSYAARFYRRVHVSVACAGTADDVWVALSGVAVAAFTFTLWRSTEKLWQAGELQRVAFETTSTEQTKILNRQTVIAEKHNVVYGPILSMDAHKILITRNKVDSFSLDNIGVGLVFKNFGQTPAINVNYIMGPPAFIDYVDVRAESQSGIAQLFADRIFQHSTRTPGGSLIPSQGTLVSDIIIFDKETLRSLFKKEKQAIVWLVLTYESRLEEDDWFAETALLLEFVVVANTDEFHVTDDSIPVADPIRIAIRGQRHRQGRYGAT